MKFYQQDNVWDAALKRIHWLFDEFENVCVGFSGGKDSTICLNLALKVAEERGRLPLTVIFIDQEAEWQCVIDYMRVVMNDPRVDPVWLQVPIKLFNATSTTDPWLMCWEPGKEWIRPKEPNSVHDNVFGTDRFGELFDAYQKWRWPGQKVVQIAGVRAEESPARFKGLTTYETYGGETWGRINDKKIGHFTMYPLYDWSYTDVWKAIHDNGWDYCALYDYMYQHGVPVANMRVSNVHHESAVKQLFFLQEIEGDTWNRIVNRLSGINTAGQLQDKFMTPKKLPPMFKDWTEYRDHLLKHMISDPEHQRYFRETFAAYDGRYFGKAVPVLLKTQIACILANDFHGTKLSVFAASHGAYSINRGKKGGLAINSRTVDDPA